MIERPSEELWIQSIGELTEEQRTQVFEVAREEVYNSAQQDSGYLRGIVDSYLEDKGLLEQACEIAGGDRKMTAEMLGFDVVTGRTEDDAGEVLRDVAEETGS